MRAAGVRLCAGSDGIRDTWNPYGNADMLERAMFIGLRHNLPLIASLDRVAALGFPVLLGVSRKRFIGALDDDAPADARLGGSVAAALWGAQAGVSMVRVHDVRETVQALRVWAAIAQARSPQES